MVVRMRHTRSHTKNRRSHHAIKAQGLISCTNCGNPKLRHSVCPSCGKYKGREVVDIIGKSAKKTAKKKEKTKTS